MTLSPMFLQGGNAVFTVEPSNEAVKLHGHKTHYTYRIRRGTGSRSGMFFVELLTGSDNSHDFNYLGMYCPKTGAVRATQASCRSASSKSFRVLTRVVAAIHAGKAALRVIDDHGWKLHHEGRCCSCGRRLTVPASIETGIGPECETFVRLGMKPCDVPCLTSRKVAKLQLSYWHTGDDVALDALTDACMDDLDMPRERAELFALATRKVMRRFKKGKSLSPLFVQFATG